MASRTPVRLTLTLIGAACITVVHAASIADPSIINRTDYGTTMKKHPYIGMWVTKDGRIRQELLSNGRYDEARGAKKSMYQGRYEIKGSHIDYWDDTGFTADGTFVSNDELHHGGVIFYRVK